MFDMSITQYVSKILPYPAIDYNKKHAFEDEREYFGEISLGELDQGELDYR